MLAKPPSYMYVAKPYKVSGRAGARYRVAEALGLGRGSSRWVPGMCDKAVARWNRRGGTPRGVVPCRSTRQQTHEHMHVGISCPDTAQRGSVSE